METIENVRSVNEKVLAFGMIAVMLIVVVICGGLVLALYSTSTSLSEEQQTQIELRTELTEKQAVIYTLQRSLDRTEGRLGVYEEFLIGNQVTALKKMVKRFLKQGNTTSNQVTLMEFEDWAVSRMPSRSVKYGMGGG